MKRYLTDFPTQGATVFVALVLIGITGIIVSVRLATGRTFPVGYDSWLIFLATLAGVSTVGMIGKRATERPEIIRAEGEAQAKVEAAKTSGTFPTAPKEPPPTDHGGEA